MKKKIILLTLYVTGLMILVANINRKLELITTFDLATLQKSNGDEAFSYAGDLCSEEVKKTKNIKIAFPYYNVKTSIVGDKINCYLKYN